MAKSRSRSAWIAILGAWAANVPAAALAQEAADTGLWSRQHLTGDWWGSRSALEERGVTLSLEHEAETWSSGFGGLQRGSIYNGLTTASLAFSLSNALATGLRMTVKF
jgi:carbohydrate-selective porin OprB